MIGMSGFGLYLEYRAPAGQEKGALISIHSAIGLIVLVFITIGVVVLNVAGVLNHTFVDRDKTVLRMPGRA